MYSTDSKKNPLFYVHIQLNRLSYLRENLSLNLIKYRTVKYEFVAV